MPNKIVIVWALTREETNYGIAKRTLREQNHFVFYIVISSDGQFALSGSWDGVLKLWDITTDISQEDRYRNPWPLSNILD